ncbi:MAG: glucokinase [Xenococcaceae cyanobacterium MO_188.B29]|nr:glucokinase [Xenococcaceae cyanobacterium MO_188.B29]
MSFLLVGDIGRKVNLSLLEAQEKNIRSVDDFRVIYNNSYPIQSYFSLQAIINKFKKDTPHNFNDYQIEKACFAVPGPISNNKKAHLNHVSITNYANLFTKLTNLNLFIDSTPKNKWKEINAHVLQKELDCQISLINDFEAICYGINFLLDSENSKDFYPLQEIKHKEKENQRANCIAVIGSGTGLGEAFMIKQNNQPQVCASEGGHADFAPRSQQEYDLYQYLLDKQKKEQNENNISHHISVERIISGHGIVDIYEFLLQQCQNSSECSAMPEDGFKRDLSTYKKEQGKNIPNTVDPAVAIAKQALFNRDELCQDAMNIFLSAFGAEVGNFALKTLPYGGLYIAGGIAPKILPLLEKQVFLSAFKDKGRMRRLLEQIPIFVVLNQDVGIIGAIFYADRFMREQVAQISYAGGEGALLL